MVMEDSPPRKKRNLFPVTCNDAPLSGSEISVPQRAGPGALGAITPEQGCTEVRASVKSPGMDWNPEGFQSPKR